MTPRREPMTRGQVLRCVTRVATTVLGLLLAFGCGVDDEGGQARTVETTTTSPEDRDSTTTSTASSAHELDLDAVVVQLGDLPAGWTVTPPDPEDEADDSDECAEDPGGIDTTSDAESGFQQSDFGPFVGSGATEHEDEDEAERTLNAFAEAMAECDGFTQTDEDGATTVYSVSPLSFPQVGDGTFACRMSADTPFGPLNLDIVAARKGAVMLFLVNGGFGAADTELTEQLLTTMIERL
jgi:hypothetical protein